MWTNPLEKKANIGIHDLKQAGWLSLNLSERNETTLYISDLIIAFHSAVPYCVFITLAASIGTPVPSLLSALGEFIKLPSVQLRPILSSRITSSFHLSIHLSHLRM